MTPIFDHVMHFDETEKWGDTTKMNGLLLLLVDALRRIVDSPFVIHCGYREGSSEGEHALGNAVDFHIEWLELQDAYERVVSGLKELQVLDRVGLGVYRDWNHPGFHLDVRGKKARWGAINMDGKQTYVTISDVVKSVEV